MFIRRSTLIFFVHVSILLCMDQKPPRSVSWNLPPKTPGSTQKKSKEQKKEPTPRRFVDTSLHKAAREGDSERIKELIDKSDINAQNEVKDTPLHIATLLLHRKCVQLFLENNALLMVNKRGITPLDTINNYKQCFEKCGTVELMLKLRDDHSAITQLFKEYEKRLYLEQASRDD